MPATWWATDFSLSRAIVFHSGLILFQGELFQESRALYVCQLAVQILDGDKDRTHWKIAQGTCYIN